ncbi:MAG TPA: hypothetical protein EYP10_10920, partial [Armatimonadetes bacterium]|nr:hypothetical protein [Armatimonadota bacterium]
MSRVRRYGIFRDVAWLLIVALTVTLVGIFPATAGEAPAGGAEEVGIARERIAILDFTVARGVPRWMGRASADALAYAIVASEEPLWDVVPRQQVEDAIIDLKIPRKLSVADIQRLGAHLGAHYVAIGHVASAKVTRKPRTGYVQLQIKIYEVATGEVVNGAHVAERSPEGVDETKLLADALNRAAARAVQDMAATRLPLGQVLTRLPDNRLLLNIGAKDGVSANMRMSVIHTDLKTGETRKIGEITIKAVEQRQSYATIDWETQGIQQMDKVRALFTLPALGEAGRRPIVRKRRTVTSWLQGLIFPLIGLALLFGVIGQSRKAEKAPEVLSAQSLSSGEGIVVRFGKGGGTVLGVE